MEITLEDSYHNSPRNITAAAARTCYAGRLITPGECESWITPHTNTDDLLKDLFIADHTTTQEHYHLTLGIKGASRHFIWKYLHAFPYYSTDQQSQRYVEMKKDTFLIPNIVVGDDRGHWSKYYEDCYEAYKGYKDVLIEYFKSGDMLNKQTAKIVDKKAMEFARYFLPLSQKANLKYTINFITAVRMIGWFESLGDNVESAEEVKSFSKQLEKILLAIDPRLGDVITLSKNKYKKLAPTRANVDNIISKLGKDDNGEPNSVRVININNSMRDFIDGEIGNPNPLFQNIEQQIDFTTILYVSHSCDSQNQRHRASRGFRGINLEEYYHKLGDNSYKPKFIEDDKFLNKMYDEQMTKMYVFFEEQKEKYGFNVAVNLLPNAHKVLFVEKNDMAYFPHKAQKRLCYNAQEEIFHMTKEMVEQIREEISIEKYGLLAPCHINLKNKVSPICPEGTRFCGVLVWKLKFDEMKRKI